MAVKGIIYTTLAIFFISLTLWSFTKLQTTFNDDEIKIKGNITFLIYLISAIVFTFLAILEYK